MWRSYNEFLGSRKSRTLKSDFEVLRDIETISFRVDNVLLFQLFREERIVIGDPEIFLSRKIRNRFHYVMDGENNKYEIVLQKGKVMWRSLLDDHLIPASKGDSLYLGADLRWDLVSLWVAPPPPIKSRKIKELLNKKAAINVELTALIQEEYITNLSP